jgi:hypothetical protein
MKVTEKYNKNKLRERGERENETSVTRKRRESPGGVHRIIEILK